MINFKNIFLVQHFIEAFAKLLTTAIEAFTSYIEDPQKRNATFKNKLIFSIIFPFFTYITSRGKKLASFMLNRSLKSRRYYL